MSSLSNAAWQVAPAEHELANYDDQKIKYRQEVEDYLNPMSIKTLRAKKFVTISTNVLCADIRTSSSNLHPLERDLYLPLEINLTKWSLKGSQKPDGLWNLESHVWIVNPGEPVARCINSAKDHQKLHKINQTLLAEGGPHDAFISHDLQRVIADINSKIGPDRVIFSLSLKYCRQDLGCLKWLIRETGKTSIKPVRVYSLEDFYVVASRRFITPEEYRGVGQGVANYRMTILSNPSDLSVQCDYHNEIYRDDSEVILKCCAKAMAETYTRVLIEDVNSYAQLIGTTTTPPAEAGH